jgi:hypothetical protein
MSVVEFVQISPAEVIENRMHFIANPKVAFLDQTEIELFGAEIVSVRNPLITIKLKNTDTPNFNGKAFLILESRNVGNDFAWFDIGSDKEYTFYGIPRH